MAATLWLPGCRRDTDVGRPGADPRAVASVPLEDFAGTWQILEADDRGERPVIDLEVSGGQILGQVTGTGASLDLRRTAPRRLEGTCTVDDQTYAAQADLGAEGATLVVVLLPKDTEPDVVVACKTGRAARPTANPRVSTDEAAISAVKSLPDVAQWLSAIGTTTEARMDIAAEEPDLYVIHAYEATGADGDVIANSSHWYVVRRDTAAARRISPPDGA
ncbi:MAG: hypothetical protein NT029_20820 [Armatimonadetes bacterium]|nr:hypothetical protein [Armatimonadota bacterium]